MQKIRVLALSAVVGGVALLSGCVAVPGDPVYGGGYGGGYGYSQPYYDNPVYIDSAPAYVSGGVYYQGGRPYYNGRPYYARPGYPAARPGYGGGRPGYPGVRPGRPGVAPGVPNAGFNRGPQLSPGGVPSRGLSSLPVVPGTGGQIRSTTNGPRDQ